MRVIKDPVLPFCKYCDMPAAILIKDPRSYQYERPLCGKCALERVGPYDVVELFEAVWEEREWGEAS